MPRSLLSSLNGSELRAQWIIRVKKVLAEVVSTSQNAFVEGKRILYAVLVANKVMDSKIKQGVPGSGFLLWNRIQVTFSKKIPGFHYASNVIWGEAKEMNLLLCFFGEILELCQLGMMIVDFLGPFMN
ncbi:hypothetical protein MTR67_000375 [Solanum verrucosum]|uniref:Uncharacterized protein n=1 Tax=Solanum verrucosum TaxID=315347 RepID=A0AAF0PPY0_SOLVR|nr:hypothetical protein MTR67_000375 [Solanum verrucosum]